MSKAKKATAGMKLAGKFCKFPDGRVVYGPVWGTELAKAIDRLIARERRKERDDTINDVVEYLLREVGTDMASMVSDEFAGKAKKGGQR